MAAAVDYFEIGTAQPDEARAFYGPLFGWRFGEPSPVGYRMVDGERGGMWDTSTTGGGTWAIFYVRVDDVASAVEQAVGLGGSVLLPLVDNGAIEFAHLQDPVGNRFGVWRPKG
ncbi:MAG: VOC family protein [Curtobacterium sp.]